jgi:uncharacterized HAD superfamily protein
MRIGLDIDGVLAQYYTMFRAWHSDRYEALPPVDSWHTTSLSAHLDIDEDERWDRVEEYMDECLARLDPVPGSQAVIDSWRDEASFVAITRRPETYHDVTWQWLVHTYGDVFDGVECTTHFGDDGVWHRCKGKLCVAHDVDVFVDDIDDHVGRARDEDVLGVLFSQPWNEGLDVSHGVQDWDDADALLNAASDA